MQEDRVRYDKADDNRWESTLVHTDARRLPQVPTPKSQSCAKVSSALQSRRHKRVGPARSTFRRGARRYDVTSCKGEYYAQAYIPRRP
jgi:hypothetical protein